MSEIKPIHHVGISSGVVDGAAAIPADLAGLCREARAEAARGASSPVAEIGDSPTLMLNAPVPAARKVLAKAGLTVADIDVWEINEAFAIVAEKFIRDLGLDRAKVNPNGGSIALGHPICRDRPDHDRHRARRVGAHRWPLWPDHDVRAAGGMAPANHHRAHLIAKRLGQATTSPTPSSEEEGVLSAVTPLLFRGGAGGGGFL